MDELPKTMNEILDNLFCQRIENECRTGDEEADHMIADSILVDIALSMGLRKTVEAYKKVERYYA